MLDNGYSLSHVELLNWGNFHGFQKFSMYDSDLSGPLFRPAPASAILGVNGSGKSTLIDAMMIALLPFEGSLKLGVTNDVEAGAGGGRTIRDYVLGKHSSNSGVSSNPESLYGRKEGCSVVLLVFSHNRNPDRTLTLGRAWWCHNYKVHDGQLGFLTYKRISIADLCPGGRTPTTAKALKQLVKSDSEAASGLQVFETMQNYFTALSQALGGVTRDDLKILNRAFFVKSISNIDLFIRENMLMEQESPNMDRLMENVRNGQEIALSIQTCESKISSIGRILRELSRLAEFTEQGKLAERQMRLLSLHLEWSEWRGLVSQKKSLDSELSELSRSLPGKRKDADLAGQDWRTAESRLLSDDVQSKLIGLDQRAQALKEKIGWRDNLMNSWRKRAENADAKLPKSNKEWMDFFSSLAKKISSNQQISRDLNIKIEQVREQRYALDAEAKILREEMEHISRSGTLIPRELHKLRELAVATLSIPETHLRFVGELLQVRSSHRSFKVAVEATLFPISRNLLCHPDHLNALTKWLDQEGLKTDVTVKRIFEDEMNDDVDESGFNEAEQGSVLNSLEMRSRKEHPFSGYLWRWLKDTFDYQVVDAKTFKTETGKLVTEQGLVKKDLRTMRKLKKGFAFSLGWENSERIDELGRTLLRMQNDHSALNRQIETMTNEQTKLESLVRLYLEIETAREDIGAHRMDQESLVEIEKERKILLEKNPDYEALRKQVTSLAEKFQNLTQDLLKIESAIIEKQHRLAVVAELLPKKERELKESKLYQGLLMTYKNEGQLEVELTEIQQLIESGKKTRLELQAEAEAASQKAEQGRGRAISMAAANLGNYRHQFNDPNLPYDLGGDFSLEAFLNEWNSADQRLRGTELPGAQEKWRRFFDQVLLDSVKDMINEIRSRVHEISETVRSINEVLKLTNFEDLVTEQRYLRIDAQTSVDERIRRFRKSMSDVEKTLSPSIRARIESSSQEIMKVLLQFVEELQKDLAYRAFVTDVRNHFQFTIHSLRRSEESSEDIVVEIFSGSKKDAKSSAQTTQLAYALLASCLAYRFHFHDPIAGADTPRLIVLDEFGGKFDNEKPREILRLLDKMGFQSVLVSPMSKADLLADGVSRLILVHKVSATNSKVQSYQLQSRDDYQRLLDSVRTAKLESQLV